MNKRRYNHGYEIYKEYNINEIFQLIEEKDLIPDPIVYSKKDYQDSKTRIKIIKQLIERDGCQCVKCKEKGMCYKKLETNESICEPCVEGEKYIPDCNNTYYDACPPPNDIYNFSGGKPYSVLVPDNNIYNPYNTKCKSCEV